MPKLQLLIEPTADPAIDTIAALAPRDHDGPWPAIGDLYLDKRMSKYIYCVASRTFIYEADGDLTVSVTLRPTGARLD